MSSSEPLNLQGEHNPTAGQSLDGGSDLALAERNVQVARLRTFLRWLLVFVVGIALLQASGAIFRPSRSGIIGTTISSIHVVLLLVAWAQMKRGRLVASVVLIGAGFVEVAIFGALGIPDALAVYVLFPLLSAVVALPFLQGRALRGISIIIALISGLIAAVAMVRLLPGGSGPSPFQKVTLIGAIGGLSGLTMLLLAQFHRRMATTLVQMRAANMAL
jgi:hypothetical protein